MMSMLLQLSVCLVSVIQMTSCQSTYDVILEENDVTSCGRNELALIQLMRTNNQLMTMNSELMKAVSQLQGDVAHVSKDVAELKADKRQKDASGIR